MGHEGQLDNRLDDCCGYLACVFTGDGFHRASIRFYVHLAEELIDNNINSRPQCQRNSGEDGSDSNDESPVMTRTGRVRVGISCHLTPTECRRCTGDGELTVQRLQGCCIECGKKTTYLCSACMDNDNESKTPWLCHIEK